MPRACFDIAVNLPPAPFTSHKRLVEDGHDTARATARVLLCSASAFLSLIPVELRAPLLPRMTDADAVAAAVAERTARVRARRAREDASVEKKRKILRAQDEAARAAHETENAKD